MVPLKCDCFCRSNEFSETFNFYSLFVCGSLIFGVLGLLKQLALFIGKEFLDYRTTCSVEILLISTLDADECLTFSFGH